MVPGGNGILGKGTKGLCTPIGDMGDLGTGDGGLGIITVPRVIMTSTGWWASHGNIDQVQHMANKVDRADTKEVKALRPCHAHQHLPQPLEWH